MDRIQHDGRLYAGEVIDEYYAIELKSSPTEAPTRLDTPSLVKQIVDAMMEQPRHRISADEVLKMQSAMSHTVVRERRRRKICPICGNPRCHYKQ